MSHFHLTRRDCEACLRLLSALEGMVHSPEQLARACVEGLRQLVPDAQARFVHAPQLVPHERSSSVDLWDLPLSSEPSEQVRLILTRAGAQLTPRELARLALIAPHLVFLYGQACRNVHRPAGPMMQGITPREHEVLRWVSCGKTDADIAALLAISPRTVHKHLEHIYVKLGVETRTAAVMRARGPD